MTISYRFTFDDTPAPRTEDFCGERGRLIMRIDGVFANSIIKTVGFFSDGSRAAEIAKILNQNPQSQLIGKIIEAAQRAAKSEVESLLKRSLKDHGL